MPENSNQALLVVCNVIHNSHLSMLAGATWAKVKTLRIRPFPEMVWLEMTAESIMSR